MVRTGEDGSAGDADYGAIGRRYSDYRRPDPRIAATIHAALGDARTVLNVGAGAGSYEPDDRPVTAVEPSATMRAQRPAHLSEAIDATAESLPFEDDSFDAAMTTFSVHQWRDLAGGLTELRRVTTGPVVVVTAYPERVQDFWLTDYAPDVLSTEARRYPATETVAALFGGSTSAVDVPIPLDCTDGFNEAYYGRPEMLLDPAARQSCSAWSFVSTDLADEYTSNLERALADGSWDSVYGHLRTQPTYTGSLVVLVNTRD